jgi:hypothetical protein
VGKRRFQVFVAPGTDAKLPLEPSPWHRDRRVKLYLEHWQLLLQFARILDPDRALLLRQCSTSDDRDDYVHLSDEKFGELSALLDLLARTLPDAAPLIERPTAEIPDDFINEEYARMVRAVRAVVDESRRVGQPFQAWIE